MVKPGLKYEVNLKPKLIYVRFEVVPPSYISEGLNPPLPPGGGVWHSDMLLGLFLKYLNALKSQNWNVEIGRCCLEISTSKNGQSWQVGMYGQRQQRHLFPALILQGSPVTCLTGILLSLGQQNRLTFTFNWLDYCVGLMSTFPLVNMQCGQWCF